MIGVDFIQDLGIVVLLAAAVAWLCQRLGLPVVLGYLTVGVLVGPHTPSLPLVTDAARIHTLAQLGLVFLIFSIGQGLRLQRLKRVGIPLILATVLTAVLILNGGRLFGLALGWPGETGLVLASLLMVSSTAIIGKSLRDTHTLHSSHGQTALTVTALDDLVAVVMLTILTSLAQAGPSDAVTVMGTILRLNAVLISLLVLALLLVPPLLRYLARRALPEVQTLLVVGLLLLMALLSAKAGFSAALGAFLLGAIVSSSGLGAQIERSVPGLCDVFGAVFFVAMGMLFDFALLAQVWPLVLGLFLLAMVGRALAASLALLAVGYSTREAVKAGLALTAIGEFTLILALVAVEGGLAPPHFYPIAVALCLLTAATTPFLIRLAPAVGDWLDSRRPERLRLWFRLYHDWIEQLRRGQQSQRVWRIIGPRLLQIAVQLLLISGLLLLAAPFYSLAQRWLGQDWPTPGGLPTLFWFGFGVVLLAPLVALWRMIDAVAMMCAEVAVPTGARRAALRPIFKALLQAVAVGASALWLATLLPHDVLGGWHFVVLLVALGGLAIVLWRQLVRWHSRLEVELRAQLADTPLGGLSATARGRDVSPRWQLQASDVLVSAGARAVGCTIQELSLRDRFACTVMAVERQGVPIPSPAPDTALFPNDTLLLVGREEDLRRAEQWLTSVPNGDGVHAQGLQLEAMGLLPLSVPSIFKHSGKRFSELGLRARWGVQVVAVERQGRRLVAPGSSETLQPGDQLLVLGTPEQVRELAYWLST